MSGQVQGPRPCRGSKGEQPFAGRDQSEDLRGHKSSRRGGGKGSAKSPDLQSRTRLVAESDLCGKQPPGVERRESHRTKKIGAISVVDDERSNRCHIVLHTVHRPSEDGDAVRSRCRASPAARGPGGAEPPGRQNAAPPDARTRPPPGRQNAAPPGRQNAAPPGRMVRAI